MGVQGSCNEEVVVVGSFLGADKIDLNYSIHNNHLGLSFWKESKYELQYLIIL